MGSNGQNKEACNTCRFSAANDPKGKIGVCRFDPPRAFAIPKTSKLLNTNNVQQGAQVFSAFPPVGVDWWCGKYERSHETS